MSAREAFEEFVGRPHNDNTKIEFNGRQTDGEIGFAIASGREGIARLKDGQWSFGFVTGRHMEQDDDGEWHTVTDIEWDEDSP